MEGRGVQRKLTAILSADVVGYSPNFSKPVRVYRAVTSVEPPVGATDTAPPPTRVVRSDTPPPAATSSDAPVPSSRRRAALVAGVLVALGAIGGIAAWRLTSPIATTAAVPPVVRKPSLAVLPIVNATGDSRRDGAAAQLDTELRASLSRLSGLTTITASAVMPYRSRSVSTSQAARELDVRYVLDGSVRTVDGRPRVVATLVDTMTGNILWTERFDRPLTTVAAVQGELLQRIIADLPITLTTEEQALRPTRNPAAAPVVTQPAPPKARDATVIPPATRPPRANVEARPAAPRGSEATKPAAVAGDAIQRMEPPPAPAPQRATPPPALQREIPVQAM